MPHPAPTARDLLARYVGNPSATDPVEATVGNVSATVRIPWSWGHGFRALVAEHGPNEADHLAWCVAAKVKDALRGAGHLATRDSAADLLRGTMAAATLRFPAQGVAAAMPQGAWLDALDGPPARDADAARATVELGMAAALACVFDWPGRDFGPGGPTARQKGLMTRVVEDLDVVPSVAERLSIGPAADFIGRHMDEWRAHREKAVTDRLTRFAD